jgi:hypothetical protein
VCIRRLGNGTLTRFWSDNWIDGTLLSAKFPRLFSLSLQKEAKISEMVIGGFGGGYESLEFSLEA